jgi:ABC-2 type transport system ATP-binding protein
VAVIAAGRIVAEGTPASIGGRDQAVTRVSFRLPAGTAGPDHMAPGTTRDGRVEVVAENLTATLYRLTGWAVENGIELEDLNVVRPTLEDVYLELTGGTPGHLSTGAPPETGARGHRGRRRRVGRSQAGDVR